MTEPLSTTPTPAPTGNPVATDKAYAGLDMNAWNLLLPFVKPIRHLIFDPDISEIMVNGTDGSVFVERSGEITLTGLSLPQPSLLAAVKQIARALGDDISDTQPILDARLQDGSRVAAVLPPVSLGGITLTIRKFSASHFTLEDLLARDTLTQESADLLVQAVKDRRNILISGGTGTGKTTILNILSNAIPPEDRVLLIEDTAEIQVKVPNLVRFEAKRARPGYDGTTIRDLLKAALRHRPDRIIVGEIRDHAAYDLLQALNTGHSGSMSTVHADSAHGALNRFESLVHQSDVRLPHVAVRTNIGDALHYLVQIERRRGKRFVAQILRLDGYDTEQDRYRTEALYTRLR